MKDSLQHLKLTFPKYNEKSKVKDWLEDCALYFDIHGIEGPKRSVIAGMH